MAKKSNVKISAIAVIRLIVFLLLGYLIFSSYIASVQFLTTSKIFEVKDVLIDSSIQFIDMRSLKQLKGRNIFKINIKDLEHQIGSKYPQISQLRVERELPDRIKILAKKREPAAEVAVGGKFLIIDKEGVSLNYAPQALPLPIVMGAAIDHRKVVLGAPVGNKELRLALFILNEFKVRPRLAKLNVVNVDTSNLSKIDLTLSSNAHIIIDQEQMLAKIDMLEMLLNQNRIDFNRVKYIDIRFKEPVIADNIEEKPLKEK
jgi:cell division protein FtsQ